MTLVRLVDAAVTGRRRRVILRRPLLTFYYFAAEQRGGAAILYVPSAGAAEVYPLPHNEASIREKSAAGATLPLPEILAARLSELPEKPTVRWPYEDDQEPCPYELTPAT